MKRNLGKADELFDIPAIDFFISKNDYFGSCGENFRYKLSNIGENIQAEIWRENLCYEKADIELQKDDFPLTADGLTESIVWLFKATGIEAD